MDQLVGTITSTLTQGISGMATGIGSGLQSLVSNIFLQTSGDSTTLSTFGYVICIFGGVALARPSVCQSSLLIG